MSAARIPKWIWALCAAGTLVSILLFLFRDHSPETPKSKTFVSIYGEPVTFSDTRVQWVTGEPTSYIVTMSVSGSADMDQRTKQADELFDYYIGSHADDLGFKRVVIRPDDGSRPGEIDILGFKLQFRASVGTGPASVEDLEDGIVYEKQFNGVWARGGFKPDAPFLVEQIVLPTSGKFALTYSIEDYPAGWFVYECLSCHPEDASSVLAAGLYPLLQSASKLADHDHLRKISVAIFTLPRKSTWQFPTVLHIRMAKQKGQWITPKLGAEQIKSALAEYVRKMAARSRTEA